MQDNITVDDKALLVNLSDKYSKIRRNYMQLKLQRKELDAKIKSIQFDMENAQQDLLQIMNEKNIPEFQRNNLFFEIVNRNTTKPVNKSEIIDKLSEIVGEDKVAEAKNIVSQNRQSVSETILKVKEVK